MHVTVQDGNQPPRSMYRTVGQSSSFGANPMEQHIGLGPNASTVTLDIWWPASNTRQHFTNVAKNQFIEIKEFTPSYTPLQRKPFRLRESAPAAASMSQSSK
ncbi:ASPIC/UnbV domain-containing protein [Terracidiphilus sp.]|uniref:ASPIC/UnbV domain-containing protein n=1 Tax=Terracidiphilus sp. TaxID=1964191 RepID=UPI003C29A700